MAACALLLAGVVPVVQAADALHIAAGAGYRKPLMALIEDFSQSSPVKVEASFGHMKQIETQARQSADVALLLGDRAFLEPMGLADRYVLLGEGRLALVWRAPHMLREITDLQQQEIARIALPDTKRAVYGAAATQCLAYWKLDQVLADRLIEADTVPQVGTYVALGEVDAGFVNLTEALALQDRIGGYALIDPACHTPIEISIGVRPEHAEDPAVAAWLAYLQSAPAQAILTTYGLQAR
ncbi:molybdate ABC transporter substrate-binding protein [Alcaligenaceae bacterium SJ-26]|nr:molybdate ABC transporter substrate-binding protein [Alcaligenaceae bacterium SJ-26]